MEAPPCPRPGVLFHVSSPPARAVGALIARILDLPEIKAETDELFALPVTPAPDPLPQNAAPAWVPPLLRLMKSARLGQSLARASGPPSCRY
ncbi:hypothetical protein [Paracoccus sp. (in: a-proteobacteria)]|uniref:hypothetical protein n=1 Tax=Paracoccus sp. TaxID=267 RepID=UPI002AFF391C|nr:hypothetical protein [Paracoccus sp. (in: a-proteobacteria)]